MTTTIYLARCPKRRWHKITLANWLEILCALASNPSVAEGWTFAVVETRLKNPFV